MGVPVSECYAVYSQRTRKAPWLRQARVQTVEAAKDRIERGQRAAKSTAGWVAVRFENGDESPAEIQADAFERGEYAQAAL